MKEELKLKVWTLLLGMAREKAQTMLPSVSYSIYRKFLQSNLYITILSTILCCYPQPSISFRF